MTGFIINGEVNKVNLLDQYGIKEVADVTIYSIHKKEDGSGEVYYVPALYLDTLKVSTTEKTADNAWAQGGLGNSRLVGWDYGKVINLTFEDALCTPASLGLCWGGTLSADWKDGQISQNYGINDLRNCGTERISRMEKAFYPRNDTVNATISNLLPRDGSEDILEDQSGDPVYLQRSSVLDGTDVRGFGYVNGHPYKWRAEIESEVKSIAIVPDRFFSIYGKSYPIKRKQTVGINQPSESFKYEIIYLRGYDKYDDEKPQAKIIYHRQAEENIEHEYTCEDDKFALKCLDNFTDFPFLKIRVCYDGSIKAFLGGYQTNWDYLEIPYTNIDTLDDLPISNRYRVWIEIPQIDTTQFRNIDLWVRFDSLNALSYYILTKYENDIFSIGSKKISGGLSTSSTYTVEKPEGSVSGTVYVKFSLNSLPYDYKNKDEEQTPPWSTETETYEYDVNNPVSTLLFEVSYDNTFESAEISGSTFDTAMLSFLRTPPTGITVDRVVFSAGDPEIWVKGSIDNQNETKLIDIHSIDNSKINNIEVSFPFIDKFKITKGERGALTVPAAVGKDYDLIAPDWETFGDRNCTPCCKKANLSRSLWTYVNPKTMTPYDDDYWFHQGEVYYKKSLTISTKDAPIKAQRIYVNAGVFPGMYKIVGETYIRSRETGEDERVQLSFPLCKIKSNQTLTLQADGDPTTFNLEVEVATPENNIPMEITFYEVEKDVKKSCCGSIVEKDGSTRISAK